MVRANTTYTPLDIHLAVYSCVFAPPFPKTEHIHSDSVGTASTLSGFYFT